jgi:hypothetical protein
MAHSGTGTVRKYVKEPRLCRSNEEPGNVADARSDIDVQLNWWRSGSMHARPAVR